MKITAVESVILCARWRLFFLQSYSAVSTEYMLDEEDSTNHSIEVILLLVSNKTWEKIKQSIHAFIISESQ